MDFSKFLRADGKASDSKLPETQIKTSRQFQIIDLMILTAAIAFVFMIHQSLKQPFGGGHWLQYVYQFVLAGTSGIFLAAFLWLPLQLARTGRLFLHPGHWILGSGAIVTLGLFGFWIVNLLAENNEPNLQWFAYNNFVSTGLQLISMGFLITACFACPMRWRVPIALLALSCLATGLLNSVHAIMMLDTGFNWIFKIPMFISFGNHIISVCTVIAICIAVVMDLQGRTQRDWLHWMGLVAMLIQLTLLPVVLYLLIRFAPMN